MKPFLIAVLGVWLSSGLAQAAPDAMPTVPAANRVSGEVEWVDLKLGKLQLRDEGLSGHRATKEYRINLQETNVTDASDKHFLSVEDLRAGQLVAIEFDFELPHGEGEKMARKITVESVVEPVFLEATGTLEAMDVNAGTLALNERGHIAYFVFEPRDIVVMQSPSRQPVRLELKRGDPVKVEYTMRNGTQRARAITLYSSLPELTDQTTTTTTTTSTTVTR